jgi:hypothetical protein
VLLPAEPVLTLNLNKISVSAIGIFYLRFLRVINIIHKIITPNRRNLEIFVLYLR